MLCKTKIRYHLSDQFAVLLDVVNENLRGIIELCFLCSAESSSDF